MAKEVCLSIKNLCFDYSKKVVDWRTAKLLLNGVSFNVNKGEIVSILGPNGCGKSTLLNLVAAFLNPVRGEILRLNSVHTQNKVFSSIVFQELGLLDWKSAAYNIELGLLFSVPEKEKRFERVNENLKLLGVFEHRNKFPKELSGGLKQRVAIARALAPNPELLLLDEPFSALDWKTKETLLVDLLSILRKKGITVLLVTHDIGEAIFLSDRILVLNKKIIGDFAINFPKKRDLSLRVSKKFLSLQESIRKLLLSSSP